MLTSSFAEICLPANLRSSSQKAASTQRCERSNGLLLLSATFDVLRCAVEDSEFASAACTGAVRSIIIMGQCLLAALAQVRSHHTPSPMHNCIPVLLCRGCV